MRLRERCARAGRWLIGPDGRWLLLFTTVFLLTRILSANPGLTESLYSRGLYPIFAAILGTLSDLVPFSLQEWLVIGALGYLLYRGWRGICRLRRKETSFKLTLKAAIRRFSIVFVLVYTLFYLLWGFNYFRTRLIKTPRFATTKKTSQALDGLLATTIREVNRHHEATLPEWDRVNTEIETQLGACLQNITGCNPTTASRIKGAASGWLAAFGVSGISLPFLHEAHLAGDLFDFERPFIAAHEKTHLKGRTSEAEANFFAWLACTSSSLPAVRYSGHFGLLGYLLGALPREKQKMWIRKIDPAVLRHFKMRRERNRKRSRLLSRISRSINNLYLKANRVEGGIRNYSMVVKLALAWRTPPGR